jgi:outer membrane protein assembly factor BamB
LNIKNNMALKVSLAIILLLVTLTFFGCTGIRNSPEGGSGGVIADGTLFLCPTIKQAGGFGCSAPQLEGKLVAVDTANGNRLWEVSLEASGATGGGFGCAPSATAVAVYGNPAVAGDMVYIAGYNGRIYEVDASTRLSQDKYVNETSPQPIIGGVVVVGDMVYLSSADGNVYALNAASLEEEWRFETGGKVWSTPVIEDGTLYISSFDKKLYALDAGDGTEKWDFATEGAIISTPFVYDNTVYFGSFDRYLYAVDSGGSLNWKFLADNWFWSRPVVYGDTVYAPCMDGKTYLFDAESGDKINEFDLESPISSSPVLAGGSVIVASEEGAVYAIDTATSQLRRLTELGETVRAPLCTSDGVVYVYTGERNLYALDAESGATLWSIAIK